MWLYFSNFQLVDLQDWHDDGVWPSSDMKITHILSPRSILEGGWPSLFKISYFVSTIVFRINIRGCLIG